MTIITLITITVDQDYRYIQHKFIPRNGLDIESLLCGIFSAFCKNGSWLHTENTHKILAKPHRLHQRPPCYILPTTSIPLQCKPIHDIQHIDLSLNLVNIGAISFRIRSSFPSTKYTSLGVILPPKFLSEMAPWYQKTEAHFYCKTLGLKTEAVTVDEYVIMVPCL